MHKIVLAGENSILIYFGNKIDSALPKNIANFANLLKTNLLQYIVDLTPSYTSLLVSYNVNLITHNEIYSRIESLLEGFEISDTDVDAEVVYIPVYYSFETGLDLERLLSEKDMSMDDFIDFHSSKEYLIYAIGFAPNFAFLGEVDKRIQAPRLVTPRIKIPAGSVGIAQSQTAIYPTDSSGGWNIVGRTLLDLSLKNPENVDKFTVGDYVKFYPITRDEYIAHGGKL